MSDSYSTLAPQGQGPPDPTDLPDLTDLSSLTEIASSAESLLLDWMRNRAADELPPPIKDITAATQALWRLTAVRKTLLGLQRRDSDRFDPDPWSNRSTELTDEEIERLIRRGEEFDLLEDEHEDEDPALELGAATDGPESPAPAPDPAPAPSPPRPRSTTVPSCPTIPAISARRVPAPPTPPAQTHASALAPPPPTAPGSEFPEAGAPAASISAPGARQPGDLLTNTGPSGRGPQALSGLNDSGIHDSRSLAFISGSVRLRPQAAPAPPPGTLHSGPSPPI